MPTRPTILIVEDDPVSRMHLEHTLNQIYHVISVASGEACLAACAENRPDVILLDVEMAGIDGYETCRRLKANDPNAPAVIFVSSHDLLENKLEGYDAGGEDYILKPVEPAEVERKIDRLLKMSAGQEELSQRFQYANQAALTAMNCLGETGILLRSFQRFNSCATFEALANSLLETLREFSLQGMVRISSQNESISLSTQGELSPIEAAIIDQVAGMGRMLEFRSRLSISYDHAVLVITNAPTENEELRGRLRDHLAILGECADSRALAIHRGIIIERALRQTNQALMYIQDSEKEMQTGITLALQQMARDLERALVSAALTEEHETSVLSILDTGLEGIRNIMLSGESVLPLLEAAIQELSAEIAT